MSYTSTLVLGPNAMSITRNPTASNLADMIPKNTITHVGGTYDIKPNNGEIPTGTITGNYTVGETITGGTSGATAKFVGYRGIGAGPVLILKLIVGTFVSGETLTGGTSGATSVSSATVTPLTYSGEWKYPYNTLTILQIERNDGSRLSIELQDVSNQATWNTGTQAALQQAITDIQTWI